MVGQVSAAVGTAIPPVTIIQVGLKRLGLNRASHGGGRGSGPTRGVAPRGAEEPSACRGRSGLSGPPLHTRRHALGHGDSLSHLACCLPQSQQPLQGPELSVLTHGGGLKLHQRGN